MRSTTPFVDHYAVLGLTPNATKEEIRKAHRRLVAIHHPDKNHGKSPRTLQSNTDKFRNVQEAYEVLSDADRKATFDNILNRRQRSRPPVQAQRSYSYSSQPANAPGYRRAPPRPSPQAPPQYSNPSRAPRPPPFDARSGFGQSTRDDAKDRRRGQGFRDTPSSTRGAYYDYGSRFSSSRDWFPFRASSNPYTTRNPHHRSDSRHWFEPNRPSGTAPPPPRYQSRNREEQQSHNQTPPNSRGRQNSTNGNERDSSNPRRPRSPPRSSPESSRESERNSPPRTRPPRPQTGPRWSCYGGPGYEAPPFRSNAYTTESAQQRAERVATEGRRVWKERAQQSQTESSRSSIHRRESQAPSRRAGSSRDRHDSSNEYRFPFASSDQDPFAESQYGGRPSSSATYDPPGAEFDRYMASSGFGYINRPFDRGMGADFATRSGSSFGTPRPRGAREMSPEEMDWERSGPNPEEEEDEIL